MPKLLRQKPGGYVIIDNDGVITEMASSTCGHCNHITLIPPNSKAEDVGIGVCHGCFSLICKDCAGKGCTTIERWCEIQESKARFQRAIDEWK
jgi:hypothetical protein